ncbi:MAG: CotH kinase family protein [Bacteroidaceae bacterium]|nr:CotH kinase family protein [Bacteroidaceae bacterium]
MELTKLLRAIFILLLFDFNVYAYDARTDMLLSGTTLASSNKQSAGKAFDDDASTYFSSNSSLMEWVGLDLGSPHVITHISFTPVANSMGPDRMLLSLFEGANDPDFMDALPLYLIAEKPAARTATDVDVNVSRGFRYVRYVGSSGSYCNVAELKFYGHAGEGDDSQFYQVTNIPTLSIHVKNAILPTTRGEDFESQSVLIYEGGKMVQEYPILFRVRGNYSSTHENKAFRMKYNDGKSHHVMKDGKNESPVKAKKWVLINSYRDKTLMRNPVAWAMSRRGEKEWTPWCQVVDLIVNGDYHGTYTLADHVDVHSGRIDITEMSETDLDEETITGGYYVEVDNNASREPYYFYSSYGNPISVHDPDEDIIQPKQFQYIEDTFNNMESIVFGPDYTDPEKGFRSVLDIESFLRWFLISEFNGNTDMICQVFMFKERGDNHFYTGPIWDADLALENDQTTYPANERMDWTYKVRQTGNWREFVSRILSDPSVIARLQNMWVKLRKKGAFEPADVAADVDSIRREIQASARLNFIRWPYLNQWLSLNPDVPGSWEKEVDRVRDFVAERVSWMDNMLNYGTLTQKDGIYQIYTPYDLCTFAGIVNGGEKNASAVLMADIDMAGYEEDFVPIGNDKIQYTGKFDGGGHTISNLKIMGKNNVGFFGMVASGTEIKDLNFDATCSVSGVNYVGGLIGYVRTGTVKINGCSSAATVTATGSYAAAFLGYVRMLGIIYMQDSYNLGKIQADSLAAALIAPSKGKLYITDCYNAGKVTGTSQGQEFAYTDLVLELQNCYDAYSNQVERVTPIDVMSGALCYLLNTGGDGATKWRQNIDNGRKRDVHPVLNTSSGIVYNKNGVYTNINKLVKGYRYYKWDVRGIRDGYNGTIQFADFDILDATGEEYASLHIYNGTESNIAHHDWPDAGDSNVYTKYCSSFNNRAFFLYDAQEEVIPYGYRIYTANDTRNFSGRNPCTWRLYGSNTYTDNPDDNCWEIIDSQTNNFTLEAVNYTPFDFWLVVEDKETGISSMDNGQWTMDNSVYDLSGRKMVSNSKLLKGIYIINGKKIIFR